MHSSKNQSLDLDGVVFGRVDKWLGSNRLLVALFVKVQNAEKCGAVGALLYSDPADYSPEGMNNTFPKTLWLPGTATQRGNIWFSDGDPLTPLLPSIDGVYRITRNDTDVLPNIPAQVLNYVDAEEFLKRLKGGEIFLMVKMSVNCVPVIELG